MTAWKVFRVLGAILMGYSFIFVPPAIVAFAHSENSMVFILSTVITLGSGLVLWILHKQCDDPYAMASIQPREGYLITASAWIILCVFSAIPFQLDSHLNFTVTEAVFEAVSGLTTTGATVVANIEAMPMGLLFYRQFLQWVGGLGLLVIAVALLPFLKMGGARLFRSELPSTRQDKKIMPRMADTAKAIAKIYLVLSVGCAAMYYLAGMSVFDAISHSMSTVAIGGFSTYNDSLGHFDSMPIYLIATFFMLLSGINFTLHYYLALKGNIQVYLKNSEFLLYITIIVITLIVAVAIVSIHSANVTLKLQVTTAFQVVSILTTTGFTAEVYNTWPPYLGHLLISLAIIGGCFGSTAGGIKMWRLIYVMKQSMAVFYKHIHPSGIFQIKIDNRMVQDSLITNVWVHCFVYFALYQLLTFALIATGISHEGAWSAAVAVLSNLGPALGEFSNNYITATDFAKWLLSIGMILGRLEMIALLILFIPKYWHN